MLCELFSQDHLRSNVTACADWQPYPRINDRTHWDSLPDGVRDSAVSRGEKLLGFEWPELQATLFLQFKRNGNRSNYEGVRGRRRGALCDLVIAECFENEGRFLDDIVNGIWATCEETYWGVPAHIGAQKAGSGLPDAEEPTVDLFAAETSMLLSWTYYLLNRQLDTVSPLVRPRIACEIKRRILDPCWERDDFWWMGLLGDRRVNNWNPWICSNWLTSTLLMETDEDRRVATVHKILRCLDAFIDVYGDAGGCDEGPGYWGRAGASLFDCLELLYMVSNGAVNVFNNEKIGNMGRFVYQTHIHDRYYVNFADASAITSPNGSLVYRFGKAIGDAEMMRFGAWLLQRRCPEPSMWGGIGRMLPTLAILNELMNAPAAQPMPRDAWYDDIQVMVARDNGGSESGFFVAAKGGHNAESHNHNDIGNFIVYADGKPLLVDAGVETYTRQTFSGDRYKLWTMQSGYHNLISVNGVMQSPGREFRAVDVSYSANDESATLAMDIAAAFPAAAKIKHWNRSITLQRGQAVAIDDEYALDEPGNISISLMTPCRANITGDQIQLESTQFCEDRESGSGTILFDSSTFDVQIEEIPIEDRKLGSTWGKRLFRIRLEAKSAAQTGKIRICVHPVGRV